MRKKNLFFIVGIIFCAVGGYYYVAKSDPLDIPEFKPNKKNISAEFLATKKSADYCRAKIEKNPDLVENYIRLAEIFIQQAKSTGNEKEYYPAAQRLLDAAISKDRGNIEALSVKAGLFATLHQFTEAKKLAQKAISIAPYYSYAYGVLCDAQVELGEYDAAVKTSDKLLSFKPDLRAYARASYIRELHGDLRGAAEAMVLAANAGIPGSNERSWTLYQLGMLFANQGKLDTAEFFFKGILEEQQNYPQAFAGLGYVSMLRGKYPEVEAHLKKAYEILPEHGFMEQLAGLYKLSGKPVNEKKIFAMVKEIFLGDEEFGENINREYAAFCFEHGADIADALARALKEYSRRPNNIYVQDTYAWGLFKTGKYSEAKKIALKAIRLGTKDPILLYHAGIICSKAGDIKSAKKFLQQAIDVNPRLQPMYAAETKNLLAKPSKLSAF